MKSTQPSLNKLFPLPLVKTDNGLSIPAEVMVGVWQQIVAEGKQDLLFYDGSVKNLKEWIDYIYNPQNHVVLIIDNLGHIYHVCWLNKFYQGHGFVHHCSLGKYNRNTWPTLRDYWKSMEIINTVLGVTPVTNQAAVKLLRVIGWTELGVIPGLCYLAKESRHVGGVISFYVINEV